MNGIYEFAARQANGKEKPLAEYQGKVMLIVNTAANADSRRNTPTAGVA